MGRPGRIVATVEEFIELMYKYGGKVSHVAKHLGCSRRVVYENLDIYPEIVEAREKAERQMGDEELESSYDTLAALLNRKDDEPTVALNAAKLIVTKSKRSRYYTEQKDQENNEGCSPAGVAALSLENLELKKKLERLEKLSDK